MSVPAPAVDPGVAALLGRGWPARPPAITRAGALGFHWTAVSTPFVHRDDGRVVAHVGVIEQPLIVAGEHLRRAALAAMGQRRLHQRVRVAAPAMRGIRAHTVDEADPPPLLLTWGDLSRARYHADLDVITVHAVHERTLVLYDVVGAAIPPLDALVTALGEDVDRVVTLFVPDRPGDGFAAEPWDAARAAVLGDHDFVGVMVRGPLGVPEPFMLPALART